MRCATTAKIQKCTSKSNTWPLRLESFFNVATHIEQLDEEWAPEPKVIEAYLGTAD